MKRVLAILVLLAASLALTSGIALGDTTTQSGFATQANGGGIVADDGLVDWGVPPNASPYNLRLEYISEDPNYQVPPLRGGWVGHPFTIRPWDVDGSGLVTTTRPMSLN